MELVPGAKGKLSYPKSVKRQLFRYIHQALAPWHGKVFMYLCMEKAELWQSTFGRTYQSNEEFEADFGQHVQMKFQAAPPRSRASLEQGKMHVSTETRF